MKISEFLKHLVTAYDTHGDIEITVTIPGHIVLDTSAMNENSFNYYKWDNTLDIGLADCNELDTSGAEV